MLSITGLMLDQPARLQLLKALAANKEMTQGKLAKLAGISGPTLSNILNGNRSTTLPTLSKIAFELGLLLIVSGGVKFRKI